MFGLDDRTAVTVHRAGMGTAQVYSLESIIAAAGRGDAVEIDVAHCSDGVIAIHPDPLDGPSGRLHGRRLHDLSCEDIRSMTGVLPPLFTEVVAEARARGLQLAVEIKDVSLDAVLATMTPLDREQAIILSFLDHVVERAKRSSLWSVGLLLGREGLSVPERLTEVFPARRLRRCGADFVAPNALLVIYGGVDRHCGGLPVVPWGANRTHWLRRFCADPQRFPAVITDRPELAVTR